MELKAKVGLKSLLSGLEILRKLHAEEIDALPENVPTEFLPQMWKDVLYDEDGKIKPHHWEMGFYYALKKELGSGDVFISESRHNRYFWDTVYGEQPWKKEREQQYLNLNLPSEFDAILDELKGEYHRIATKVRNTLPNNDFVTIKDGKFHFTRDDALIISPEVVRLRKLIQSNMPSVRIEQLLSDVARFSGFTTGFTPFYSPDKTIKVPRKPLLAAIIAHAINIGLLGMGSSAVGIDVDSLTHASHTYLRQDTIKEGNRQLINHLLTYPISDEMTNGAYSTSDAQRYAIEAKCSLSSYYPRYYGYYERALSIYTHISKGSVFGTQVISTSEREATYVLTGLLENDTLLNPEFHSTDTHGYTEHIFALCHLLGFNFHPRLKDLAEQNLYKIDGTMSYGDLDDVFAGTIDTDLIRENWDQIVRIIASLKNGLAPAHVIIQKLANRTDNVSKAIRALGRIIKTIYILRYISDKDLRYAVHLHLNQGESRHQLAKKLFFLNRGVFKTSDYEEIMNKSSCLSLVSNAVLVWNTHHIQKVVDRLRAEGYVISSEHLQKISPLMFKHIQIHGTYHFEDI
ncbi:Tn3 family transposase [Legionella drancourtii]|uniref:Tn3 family transposase n=1 Tax=Legionella drancourtii TaxID=168933 RepID=UPI00058E37B9|nr:Tn3 family transposase [Legionella drancourtii]